MAFDYEKYYRENRHGLGEPTKEFVAFFDDFDRDGASVLDVGCGQGRDALFIARKGLSRYLENFWNYPSRAVMFWSLMNNLTSPHSSLSSKRQIGIGPLHWIGMGFYSYIATDRTGNLADRQHSLIWFAKNAAIRHIRGDWTWTPVCNHNWRYEQS